VNANSEPKKRAYKKALSGSLAPLKIAFYAPSLIQKTSLKKLHAESGKNGCPGHGVALGVFIILIKNIVYR